MIYVRWNLLCTYPSFSWSINKQHTVCTKALDFNSRPHIKQSQPFIINVHLRSFSAATGFFHSRWTPGIRFFPVNQLLIVLSIPCQKLRQTNKQNKQKILEFRPWSNEFFLRKPVLIQPADLHREEEVWYWVAIRHVWLTFDAFASYNFPHAMRQMQLFLA